MPTILCQPPRRILLPPQKAPSQSMIDADAEVEKVRRGVGCHSANRSTQLHLLLAYARNVLYILAASCMVSSKPAKLLTSGEPRLRVVIQFPIEAPCTRATMCTFPPSRRNNQFIHIVLFFCQHPRNDVESAMNYTTPVLDLGVAQLPRMARSARYDWPGDRGPLKNANSQIC